jgi:hypothetical protein
MFEKIGRLAETAATKVSLSRRGFWGRLGQTALGVTAVLAGVSAATAQSSGVVCCVIQVSFGYRPRGSSTFYKSCLPAGSSCYNLVPPGTVKKQFNAASCDKC